MANDRNPYLDDPELEKSPLLTRNQPPQVPVSGPNPYLPAGGSEFDYAHPATFMSNTADTLNAASNMFTFGGTDRLRGLQSYATGDAPSYSEGVNQAVADTKMRRERSPYLSIAGDVGGGVAQAFVPGAGVVGRTTSLALGGANAGVRGLAARAAGYGAEGALLGGAQAAGHTYTENPSDYAKNAMLGGAFGGLIGAPFGAFANVAPRSAAAVPGSVDLKGAARQNYTDTHTSPMQYDRSMYQGGLDALETHLQSPAGGVVKTPDNPVWAVLDYARKQTGSTPGVVTPYEIDAARQQLTGVSAKGASAVRQWLDDFMKSTHAVAGGTPADHAAVIESLDKARGNYRSGKRTQTIEEINQFAEDKGVTPQKALVGLLNPKSREGKWFTPDEKDAIRSTTNRYTMGNILSGAGNMLGGQLTPYSGTIGAGGAATAFMTGDWKPLVAGLGIPAIGYGVRKYGEHVAGQGAADLAATLAKNSPLYREAAANAPMIAGPGLGNVAESSRNAITLQLLDQLRNRGFMN